MQKETNNGVAPQLRVAGGGQLNPGASLTKGVGDLPFKQILATQLGKFEDSKHRNIFKMEFSSQVIFLLTRA